MSRTTRNQTVQPDLPDARVIDELYGLEPIWEPAAGSSEPTRLITFDCPYCGEPIDTLIDVSAGSFCYIEDCQVCCQPIQLTGEVDGDGECDSVTADRA